MSYSSTKSSPNSQGEPFVIVTPDAYGQLLPNDDDDYIVLQTPPVDVAAPPHTQGSSASIIEPDPDVLLVGRNDSMTSPLGALGIQITSSDILVQSSHDTQFFGTLANANALRVTEDEDDSEDEVVYDDTHSTLIEDILRLRISTLNTREPSDTPSDVPSGSTYTDGYETAGSEDSSPPIPSLGACTLTKSQRRREQKKRAKLRAQEANIAQEQSIEPTNVTMPLKKLTKSQKQNARRKRARARKQMTNQHETQNQVPSLPSPKKLTNSQKRSAQRKRARARKQISNQHETQNQVPSLPPAQKHSKASGEGSKRANNTSTTTQGFPKGWNFVKSDFYLNAVQYMTNYLASAPYHDRHVPDTRTRLALSQALLIETGAVSHPSALPSTQKQAKSLLKSAVHINILDYLRVRRRGLKAIQSVLFKSRAALMRDISGKKGRRADLGEVKQQGLNGFLVDAYD